jgi:hypothetical protein
MWNQEIQTDKEVLANRPNIIIKNKEDKICELTDVATPSDRNVIQKEAEMKLKYKNQRRNSAKVKYEMHCHTGNHWGHGNEETSETIPGKHSIDSLQKTVVLGTSHIIRKVLQSET